MVYHSISLSLTPPPSHNGIQPLQWQLSLTIVFTDVCQLTLTVPHTKQRIKNKLIKRNQLIKIVTVIPTLWNSYQIFEITYLSMFKNQRSNTSHLTSGPRIAEGLRVRRSNCSPSTMGVLLLFLIKKKLPNSIDLQEENAHSARKQQYCNAPNPLLSHR